MMTNTRSKGFGVVGWSVVGLLFHLSSLCTTVEAYASSSTVDGNDELVPYEPQDILRKFFETTYGFGWIEQGAWLPWSTSADDQVDFCDFFGITCYNENSTDAAYTPEKAGHIQSLNLSGNGLVGRTPPEFWHLPYLQQVYLDNNPALIVDTTDIGTAQHLEELVVNVDAISNWSAVPKVANSLRRLTLAPPITTYQDRAIPSELYQLTQLERLIANDCQFTGDLSSNPAISNWYQLQELHLNHNALQGQLPKQLGQFFHLQALNLGYNQFTGHIPAEEWNQLRQLQILDLSRDPALSQQDPTNKGLIGPVPSLHLMSNLVSVDLSYQSLSGSLPTDFLLSAPVNQPITIDLRGNEISGTKLPSILVMKQDLDLYLADNKFTSLPSQLCQAGDAPMGWLQGNVVQFENCDGLLCPVGTYSPNQGRQVSTEAPCQQCPSALYMGQTTCLTTSTGEVNEQTILQDFFSQTSGINWQETTGWISSENTEEQASTDYCTWFGITCESNQVVELRLPNNGLTGTVPSTLFSLPQLRVLDLSRNGVTFQAGSGLAQATNLQVLDLTQTDIAAAPTTSNGSTTNTLLISELLTELSQANVIQVLRLGSNPVSDDTSSSLNEDLYQLTTLQELDLSNNNYQGVLSATGLGQLVNLEHLLLQGNLLVGSLPTQVGALIALQDLRLSENQMTGTLPTELNNCRQLQHLSLRNNAFTGTLPAWSALVNLTEMDLASNILTGTLPSDFLSEFDNAAAAVTAQDTSTPTTRREFLMANNQFSGAIPSTWVTRFPNLFVDLTGNQITGTGSGGNNGAAACLAQQALWMDGLVSDYGCAAILCPVNTFNELGRQTSVNDTCRPCPSAAEGILGVNKCVDEDVSGKTIEEVTTMNRTARELAILTEFYQATQGENWIRHDGWGITADYCTWYGISCDSEMTQAVQSIVLPSNGLTNTPPSSLWELSALQELDLSGNSIQFVFDGIHQALQLLVLDLSSSQLDSVEGLDQLSESGGLRELHLNDNALAGPFPTQILNLYETLEKLSLSSNQMTGFLPGESLAQFTSLKELFLFDNRFQGQIPGSLSQLTKLQYLGLSGNQWSGTIPAQFSEFAALETLALQGKADTRSSSGRGLSGPVPAFDAMPHIQQLFLGYHSLNGNLPANFLGGITDLARSITVDLRSNRLTGGLPSSLARLENVELYAAGNEFTEPIPSSICRQSGWMKAQVAQYGCDAILCPPNTFQATEGRKSSDSSTDATCQACPSQEQTQFYGSFSCWNVQDQAEWAERRALEDLYMSTNGDEWVHRDGWLKPDVSICNWYGIACETEKSVQSIQLVHNGLRGRVPSTLFSSLPNLLELDLSYNENLDVGFNGADVAQAKYLQFLNLDYTGITNIAGLEQAPELEMLRLSGNDFGENVFPTQILQLPSLQVLYLSDNSIGTALPTTGWSTQFVGLACRACELVGPMPTFLGNLTSLQFLDLSDNDFTGTIPDAVNSLANLKVLDLSSQASADSPGLTGSLPTFPLASGLLEVFLQNNNFSGPFPTNFLAAVSNETVTIDVRFNALTGEVPSNLARFTSAQFYGADNRFTGVSTDLCSLPWNDRPEGSSGCDFILCSAGTFNGFGRATSSVPCESCSGESSANGTNALLGRTFCLAGEREILQEVYVALGGKLWKHQDGWDSAEGDVCSWYGVTCHNSSLRPGTVKGLNLNDNNMQGILPESIWMLTELTELDLSDNDIVIESFSNIAVASSLTSLNISRTTVESLAGIGEATSLQSFHCTNCNIQGPLPEEVFNLMLLEELFLNFNELTGELSDEVGQWSQLRELHLDHNVFNGTITKFLTTLSLMEVMDLGHNKFFGALPSGISSMPNLRVLAFDHQRPEVEPEFGVVDSGVVGNLPSFHQNPKLRELYLQYNHIDGSIAANFMDGVDDKSSPIVVNLESNNIHKEVPASLAQFDDLHIFLGNNLILGIAPEVCAKTKWMDGLMATGCDALLCPVGTYSDYGRRTRTQECKFCDHVTMNGEYFGSMSCLAVFPQYQDDRAKLQEIYEFANGNNWTNNKNWNNADVSICRWAGVTCDDSEDSAGDENVAELVLPSNNLQGTLGSMVFYMPRLRKLDVSGNQVMITFRDIGDSESLESLNVKNTEVVDLDGLGKATQLKELILSDNSFFGQPFPTDIYQLTELTVLEMANAGFSGSFWPTGLGKLSKLETFNVSLNMMEGTIPDVFEGFDALKTIDLSSNFFIGTLPSSLQSVPALQYLDLSGTEASNAAGMSGPLPVFANSPSLVHVALAFNSFTGSIPSNLLAGLTNPSTSNVTILLGSNILHGDVPADLSDRFGKLSMDLVDNEIESLPASICALNDFGCDGWLCPAGTYNDQGRQTSTKNPCLSCPGETSPFMGKTTCTSLVKTRSKQILEDLYKKTGGADWKDKEGWFSNPDICNWYGIVCRDNAYVETINLGSNNLINKPPKEIFEITGLQKLWLYSNPMDFSFEGIENAKDLENIQLDSTKIQSLEGVGQAPALKYLDVRFNGLHGTLPTAEIDQLHQLEVLLISDNKFFGQLPQFRNNRKLSTLRASGNALVGPLPSFDVHPLIRTIDVSHNQLFGTIPETFLQVADASKSMMLDLSENQFKGVLPAFLSRFPDLTIFVQGNQFTGMDPQLCEMDDWNSGSVGLFECDGILCPPQTFSPQGRASSEQSCQPCPNAQDAPFFGHTTCGKDGGPSSLQSSSANRVTHARGCGGVRMWWLTTVLGLGLVMIMV